MHPDLADQLDQRLWELRFKVHTGVSRMEIIGELEYLRALYQDFKIGRLASRLHFINPTEKEKV